MLRLHKYRTERGLTQKEVASILEINVNSYQRLEYGTRAGSIPLWDKLEDLFQIPQRELRRPMDDLKTL